jgi:hypothetical protein
MTQPDSDKPRHDVNRCHLVYVGTHFGDDISGLKILVSVVDAYGSAAPSRVCCATIPPLAVGKPRRDGVSC